MISESLSVTLEVEQIKALVLILKKEQDIDCTLKSLYDSLLSYLYDIMTIEEAEIFFNEN